MLLVLVLAITLPLLSPAVTRPATIEPASADARAVFARRLDSIRERHERAASSSRTAADFELEPRVWMKLVPASGLPTGTQSGAAVYDSLRDQMETFGGTTYQPGCGFTLPWLLSFSPQPAWRSLDPGSPCPGSLRSLSMVYDSARDRLVVFGGGYVDFNSHDHVFNDVWVLPLSGDSSWSLLPVAGAAPLPRSSHSAIFDPVRDRMIVYGGSPEIGVYDDLWALSFSPTPTWTRYFPSGPLPGPRAAASAIYDPERDQMILYGGVSTTEVEGSTWALSLADMSWQQLDPTGPAPPPRYGHSAALDSRRHRMLVYGGQADTASFGDQWELSLSDPPAWQEWPMSSPDPGSRTWHSMVYDSRRDQFVVFGGSVNGGQPFSNDTWVFVPQVATATELVSFDVTPRDGAIEIAWRLGNVDPSSPCWIERAIDASGPWTRPALSNRAEAGVVREVDEDVDPGQTYFYRLRLTTVAAGTHTLAVQSVRAGERSTAWALSRPTPNPAAAAFDVELSLPRRASITLALFDLAGRRRAILARGEYPAGRFRVGWHPLGASGALAPGLYFLRLDGPPRPLTRSVILAP